MAVRMSEPPRTVPADGGGTTDPWLHWADAAVRPYWPRENTLPEEDGDSFVETPGEEDGGKVPWLLIGGVAAAAAALYFVTRRRR